jgi:carboxypeptidase C (cathepsin A)
LANTVFLESPVGVGFSYSDSGNYVCDDYRTASENRGAVEAFFANFPEYKKNKFFITGESYAGIYIPMLAQEILNGEKDGTYTGAPLTGIAVGNGCSGTELGICGPTVQV